jgi:hypothetical protein
MQVCRSSSRSDHCMPHLPPLLQPPSRRGFTMDCGTKHYKHLMAHFNIVVDVFLRLDRPFQDAIADITKRMGAGMAKFIQKEVRRARWGMPLNCMRRHHHSATPKLLR